MPGSFFVTNVLLYVASGDPAKADRAEMLVGAGGIVLDGRLRVANPFRAP